MTKTFKFYLGIWAICFAMFNVIAFVTPAVNNIPMPSFWIGYVFIILSFVGNIVVAKIAFKTENLKKMFYNMPLIVIGYTGLMAMLVIGALGMIIPSFPMWISTTLCVLIAGFTAMAVMVACFAAGVVTKIDKKVAAKTFFIKSLTADAEHLLSYAKSDELKAICKKAYEAIRYSDPMSNVMLSDVDEQIQSQFSEFEASVREDDIEVATKISEELITLVDKRNKKCKLLK